MKSRVIRQGVSEDSLFGVIAEWCKEGAGKTKYRLRFMSAFATGGGVGAIAPLLDVFLAEGNNIDVIIGIDRKGTDKGALLQLDALQHAYPAQCRVSVFHAPAHSSIFHPKLYLFDSPGKMSSVIGSGNLTGGGLASNFESLIYYCDYKPESDQAQHVEEIWSMFAKPEPPLLNIFLKPLTASYLKELLPKLPNSTFQAGEKPAGATFKALWKPLSKLPLPNSTKAKPRKGATAKVKASSYLLTDVLKETRYTQMQVPIPVVEGFFGVDKHKPLEIQLSIWTNTGLSQPIKRPLVISQGDEGKRLMRRIEMPQIRNMTRPLVAIFVKLQGSKKFAFKLLPQESASYQSANNLLMQSGQQGNAQRRFIIAQPGDPNWKAVSKLLSA